jgi:hypothetical protein
MAPITVFDLMSDNAEWYCTVCTVCGAELPDIRQSEDDIVIRAYQNIKGNLVFSGYHTKCWYEREKALNSINFDY